LTLVAAAPPPTRRGGFHRLTVGAIEPVAEDAVAVSLKVPSELEERFLFEAGQHLTLRAVLDGAELRRTYSICAEAGRGQLRIGVRRLPGGAFSTYLHEHLRPGDQIEVMEPAGRFTLPLDPGAEREYVAVAAGSGITPVMSLVATALRRELRSRVTLLYGNRTVGSAMFLDELADLKDRYPDRLQLLYSFSRERQQVELQNGRLDGKRVGQIAERMLPVGAVQSWLLCGPYPMVEGVRSTLQGLGVAGTRIHAELFFVEDAPPERSAVEEEALSRAGEVTVRARLDGRETSFKMSRGGTIVDGLLTVRQDAPYSCKGGVCATCRARLVEGEVTMDHTYALETAEREDGYILTCQSHPVSDRIVVDYDA
jgi:ring-1,2-phenylacetyl-CoA epoxidase subunit PaaE